MRTTVNSPMILFDSRVKIIHMDSLKQMILVCHAQKERFTPGVRTDLHGAPLCMHLLSLTCVSQCFIHFSYIISNLNRIVTAPPRLVSYSDFQQTEGSKLKTDFFKVASAETPMLIICEQTPCYEAGVKCQPVTQRKYRCGFNTS